MSNPVRQPLCIVIAGPNGAGKTPFAREFLPKDAGVIHFVSADLIAGGLGASNAAGVTFDPFTTLSPMRGQFTTILESTLALSRAHHENSQ